MQVEGNSSPIHLNPPVLVLSTCTVLLGLILICTAGSRGRLTLPTITNSPPEMAAVVISISARAFPPHVITQAVVTATMARISFASIGKFPSLSRPLTSRLGVQIVPGAALYSPAQHWLAGRWQESTGGTHSPQNPRRTSGLPKVVQGLFAHGSCFGSKDGGLDSWTTNRKRGSTGSPKISARRPRPKRHWPKTVAMRSPRRSNGRATRSRPGCT